MAWSICYFYSLPHFITVGHYILWDHIFKWSHFKLSHFFYWYSILCCPCNLSIYFLPLNSYSCCYKACFDGERRVRMQKDKVIFLQEWKCSFKSGKYTSGYRVPLNVTGVSFFSAVGLWWVLLQQPGCFFIPKCLFISFWCY